jgi:ABC-type lipoprotein release transport system permease subunit
VTSLDLTTFVFTSLAFLAVAACASLIPACGAARTDPMQALRGE